VSHSDDLMLVALAHGRDLGVDLEFMRTNVPFETLAERYFEPEDAWRVRTVPPAERTRTFYEVWTSTEARLKASGEGLAFGTKIVARDRWSLLTLTPAEGFTAALAVEGDDFRLTCWSWTN
jgi:4'-phosphopantetheinyl transferase